MECHVARRQIGPNPKHEVRGCGCILQCFLIARDATGDVNGRGNRVFDIYQKMFLDVKSRQIPVLKICDRVRACAPRIAHTYVRIESLRRAHPLTDLQNGEPAYLARSLSGELGIFLCDLTYYHHWYNISAALK